MNPNCNRPLVSVVIPTRNRPQLLCRAVESALNQTYKELEIVVVVDGPDQSTVDAVNGIGSPRVRVIELGANVGGCEARNTGIRAAKGAWIALLDDDDIWRPEKIERQLSLALSFENMEFCVVLCRYYSVRQTSTRRFEQGGSPKNNETFAEFLLSSRGGYQSSVIFASRALFLRIPFTAGLKRHQDWDWLIRVSKEPLFAFGIVDQPLSEYFLSGGTGKVSNQSNWKESIHWAKAAGLEGTAYSRFLLKSCLRSAKRNSAPFSDLISILREIFSVRQTPPTPILRALVVTVCPDRLVDWLSDNSFRLMKRCR